MIMDCSKTGFIVVKKLMGDRVLCFFF